MEVGLRQGERTVATETLDKMPDGTVESQEHEYHLTEAPLAEAADLEDLLSRLARRMFVLVPNHPTMKMSVNQLRTCSILMHGPRSITSLGNELGVKLSNVSQIVERMVRIGIVDRYETRDDGRLRLVKLTNKGLDAMESRKRYRIARAANALARVEATKRDAILFALHSLVEAATAASPLWAAAATKVTDNENDN